MSGIDRERAQRAVVELLAAYGLESEQEPLRGTPARVAELYAELFAGVQVDAEELLADSVPVDDHTGELVIVRDLRLRSVCGHHLLPFRGHAHIAYQPAERVVGLGAFPRVVETLAARPQVQEVLGDEIADTIDAGLQPAGVLVVLEASHGCLSDRGARETEALVVTIAARGALRDPTAQAAALSLMRPQASRPQP